MSVSVQRARLSIARAYEALEDGQSGGVVLFAGRVRADRRPGRVVRGLFYESDVQVAEAQLDRIERRARSRFEVRRVVLWHRTGELAIGEISVIVGVASAHRGDAFAAARYLIDALKEDAAIWKTDRWERGSRTGRSAGGRLNRPDRLKGR